MSDTSGSGDQSDKKDIELNEAFARLERQVAENQQAEQAAVKDQADPGGRPRSARAANTASAQKSGGGVLSGIALLIALLALGAASYSTYTLWLQQQNEAGQAQAQNALASEVASLTRQLNALEGQQGQGSAAIKAEVQSLLAEQQNAVAQIESRVSSSVAELRSQIGTTAEDWLLAEAEYMLRLANQRVAMEDDVKGAIALFEAADEIIRDAEGVVAFDLREAIAADIAALKGVSAADVEGIFVQLGAVAGQVPLLQQKQLTFERDIPTAHVSDESLSFTERLMSLLTRFGAHVASLVDYRAKGEVITPILPPDEEYYLRQNLILKIQLAQLGLLRGNQAIYQQSLNDAAAAVDRHFDAEAALTQSVSATLMQLSALNIARDLPDVSASLREIRQLMARFHETNERSEP
ncbi:MAG: uroporphyrinogen-III C-methyltransferase [Pseudomonadales bacterium]